jgi:hypothetical protein
MQFNWSAEPAITRVFSHIVNACIVIGFVCALSAPAAAQPDQKAVARAYRFLSTNQRAEATLNFVHFGTDYKGQKYLGKNDNIVDSSGSPIAGHFALIYRLFWNDDGVTDIVYFCDANGKVSEVKIDKTNAVGNKPFLWANVSIQLLGNLLIEAYKDKLSEDDRQQLHKLVDNADAHGLLELSLKIDQFASE